MASQQPVRFDSSDPTVTVTAGTQTQTIPVTTTISTLDQAILLSQTGLSFLAVQGGGVVPSQSFGVLNIGTGVVGTGVVSWKVSKSTLSGGPDWLQVRPTIGSTDAAASTTPTVSVSVNGSHWPPGSITAWSRSMHGGGQYAAGTDRVSASASARC